MNQAAVERVADQVQPHPARYLTGPARTFVGAGGRVFEQSHVTDLDPVNDGAEAKTVQGPIVRSAHAVQATLPPLGVPGGYFAGTRPQQSHGIATRLPVLAAPGMAISVDNPAWSTCHGPASGGMD